RARVTFEGCRLAMLSDLDAAAIERHLHELRSRPAVSPPADPKDKSPRPKAISSRESNHRLQACREFTRWALGRGLFSIDPLAADLAADLAPFLREKLPTATVLGLPACFKDKATRWLRFDLERAGVRYRDESDRVADVHSLRSAFVASLVRSGANVRAVQLLA